MEVVSTVTTLPPPSYLSEYIRVTGSQALRGIDNDNSLVPDEAKEAEALEDDLLAPYKLNRHTPNRYNYFHHSAEMYEHFSKLSKIQRELDLKLSHEIADPLSYMGTYADHTVRFK